MTLRFTLGFLVAFLGHPFFSLAQPAIPVRVYSPNRADEDWSFLKDRGRRTDFWDPIKYIGLGREGLYLTLGGEIRFRAEGFHVKGAEADSAIEDNYLLQRYLFSADLHMGKRWRMFGELQSGTIYGKLNSPRPTDKNIADMHQGFIEYHSPAENRRRFLLRIGRQELTIGSSRMIAASQGLNVKRSFDGLSTAYRLGGWEFHGALAQLVKINPGHFDDQPHSGQDFWGAAAGRRGFLLPSMVLRAYYLGVNQNPSEYVQGVGPETRHTVGGKIHGTHGALDFDYDLIYQWGTFQRTKSIRSFAMATETGYRFSRWRFRPRASISANAGAGDADPNDDRLGSFNPLFPGNSYSGLVGLFGPTNLFDLTPSFRVDFRKDLSVVFQSPWYYRMSPRDGVYGINLNLLISGQKSSARDVGTNPGIAVIWMASPHLRLEGVITRFISGSFLSGTFAERGFRFYSMAATYRF